MIGLEAALKILREHHQRLITLESMDQKFLVGGVMQTDQAQTIPADTYTKINFNQIYDPHGVIVDSGVNFKRPIWVNVVMVMESIEEGWKNKDFWSIVILVDGAYEATLGKMIFQTVGDNRAFASGVDTLLMLPGERIEFGVYSTLATTLSGSPKENRVVLTKIG